VDVTVRTCSGADHFLCCSSELNKPLIFMNIHKFSQRVRIPGRIAAILFALGSMYVLPAQTFSSGFVYGGATFGKHLDGAGRFGTGLDFHLTPRLDLGGEIGTIHKHDVGILASGNLTFHPNGRVRREWDPFLVGGISGARISGVGGLYVNLGAGVNYWIDRRWALRGEFKGYPGGQDLGGFAEFRFGITFR
jgi:hypothetical protein